MSRRTERVPERVEIVDLTHDGRGVAKTQGKTFFIDGALPGEIVDAVRVRRRRNFDEGRVTSLIVPAAERVEPICAHFGVCGGCSLQHLAGEAQLKAKQKTLQENLRRIGNVEPNQFLEPIAGPPVAYRRRARLGVRFVKGKGRVLAGFRERFSSFVADIERCPVLASPADDLVKPISELIGALSLRQRVPQVEISVGDNRIALVFRVLDDPTDPDLDEFRQFREQHNVDVYLQRGGLDTVEALDGISTPLEYTLPEFELTFRFLPTDFIQVNADINRQMVSKAIELLSPGPGDKLLDLFCGLGNFTLPIARSGASVVGIEGDETLVERARKNTAGNSVGGVEFHVANLFADCQGLEWANRKYDAVLLDPPRAGARDVLPVIARSEARRVVYVSCNPGTLARDVGILVDQYGFQLEGAGVIDMFPHTAHTESIAQLTRR